MKQQHGMMVPMPFFGPPPPQSSPPDVLDRVPTKVFVAVKFLGDLADYTRKQIAVASSDANTEIESFENKELGLDQLQARGAACDLLRDYFSGKWKPEAWEVAKAEPPKVSMMIQCFQCGGAGSVRGEECPCCKGCRHVVVTPADPHGGG